MDHRKHTKQSLWAALCLLLVFAIPVWLTWRAVRQQQLNQELIEAVEDRRVEKVRALPTAGADANARDRGLQEITIKSVFHDLLLQLRRRGSHPVADRGATALTLAIGTGKASAEIATALLQKGADPNVMMMPELDWRLLHFAVFEDSPEFVRALLWAGAKADARDKGGSTALMLIAPQLTPPTNRSVDSRAKNNNINIVVIVTGAMQKPFSGVPTTAWAYEAVPDHHHSAMLREPPQTAAQKQAIIRILQQAEGKH